jgi:hypothetical protein
MKKWVLAVLLVLAFSVTAGAQQNTTTYTKKMRYDIPYTPEITKWLVAIKNLQKGQPLPDSPYGCGTIRAEDTGDILALITRPGTYNTWNDIPYGKTAYGGNITVIMSTVR